MNWPSGEVVSVLTFLLPGFVAAAIFYSLTSHPKPGAFDRVIQALIFTVVGQAITAILLSNVAIEENTDWIKNRDLILSILAAVFLALTVAYISNRDTVHKVLRYFGFTKETSYPSEWYSAFSRHAGCYVVLHLEGQRRLYGWPEEWPSRPDEGHFRIAEAEWLDDDQRIPVTGVSAILIPACAVEMVEFLSELHEEPREISDG